jgi:hypothetical protein
LRNKKQRIGKCHLCGTVGVLSFEHSPPRAAGNKSLIVKMDAVSVLTSESNFINIVQSPRGVNFQSGAGGYTLCASCNSDAGRWYVKQYADFAKQALSVFSATNGKPLIENEGVVLIGRIALLNVLKQIVLMFLNANPPEFGEKHQDLTRFVKDNTLQKLPLRYRIGLAIRNETLPRFSRSAPMTIKFDRENQREWYFSEVVFPPFVQVLAIDSPLPDGRLRKINWFRHHEFGVEVPINLLLHPLTVVSPIPGDYGEISEVISNWADNEFFDLKGQKLS